MPPISHENPDLYFGDSDWENWGSIHVESERIRSWQDAWEVEAASGRIVYDSSSQEMRILSEKFEGLRLKRGVMAKTTGSMQYPSSLDADGGRTCGLHLLAPYDLSDYMTSSGYADKRVRELITYFKGYGCSVIYNPGRREMSVQNILPDGTGGAEVIVSLANNERVHTLSPMVAAVIGGLLAMDSVERVVDHGMLGYSSNPRGFKPFCARAVRDRSGRTVLTPSELNDPVGISLDKGSFKPFLIQSV